MAAPVVATYILMILTAALPDGTLKSLAIPMPDKSTPAQCEASAPQMAAYFSSSTKAKTVGWACLELTDPRDPNSAKRAAVKPREGDGEATPKLRGPVMPRKPMLLFPGDREA